MIHFEGCRNFRDLGRWATEDGRRVTAGRLYRSMTPEFMTEGDLDRARNDLGIGLVLDLRNNPDRDSGPLGEDPSQRYLLDFVEMAAFDELRELPPEEALHMHLELSREGLGAAVRILAESGNGAALIHCQTGKDRTGALAAVLLRLLGVSEEDAIEDFMAGAFEAEAVHALLAAHGRPMSARAPLIARQPPSLEAIRRLLSRLDTEFGGARAYVRSLGVDDETVDRFVASMLRS